jgi:hypothetical protein
VRRGLVRVNGTDLININEPARANAWGKADLLRRSARVMSVLRDLEVERKIAGDGRGFPVLDEGLEVPIPGSLCGSFGQDGVSADELAHYLRSTSPVVETVNLTGDFSVSASRAPRPGRLPSGSEPVPAL